MNSFIVEKNAYGTEIYGDSKFRHDAIADPPCETWVVLKHYMKDKLEPASFFIVCKAMCYEPGTL